MSIRGRSRGTHLEIVLQLTAMYCAGEFEQRLTQLLADVEEQKDSLILFVGRCTGWLLAVPLKTDHCWLPPSHR